MARLACESTARVGASKRRNIGSPRRAIATASCRRRDALSSRAGAFRIAAAAASPALAFFCPLPKVRANQFPPPPPTPSSAKPSSRNVSPSAVIPSPPPLVPFCCAPPPAFTSVSPTASAAAYATVRGRSNPASSFRHTPTAPRSNATTPFLRKLLALRPPISGGDVADADWSTDVTRTSPPNASTPAAHRNAASFPDDRAPPTRATTSRGATPR
eukprot:31222-Pelagococcus_subviridis.AAC.8